MKKKICIIGAGLFGLSAYFVLKKNNLDCTIFDEKKKFLSGASTNNLNRVHLGYHYPRDDDTAKQSYIGFKTFNKYYKNTISTNFKNYYFISNNSKVKFDKYLHFCEKNNLPYKKININKFKFSIENIEGGIEVNEPIYDWNLIKESIKNKTKKLNNKIYLNEKVIKIKKKKNYFKLTTNKKKYTFDVIIDASYQNINSLISNKYKKKYKYQLTSVFSFFSKKLKNTGIAVMDGKFFSFLPIGKSNKHILYDVEHSILNEEISYNFKNKWLNEKNINKKIVNAQKRAKNKLLTYFKDVDINFMKKVYISPRIILPNVENTDKRISFIKETQKNFFSIFSAKIDHSIDIANQLLKKINENK